MFGQPPDVVWLGETGVLPIKYIVMKRVLAFIWRLVNCDGQDHLGSTLFKELLQLNAEGTYVSPFIIYCKAMANQLGIQLSSVNKFSKDAWKKHCSEVIETAWKKEYNEMFCRPH